MLLSAEQVDEGSRPETTTVVSAAKAEEKNNREKQKEARGAAPVPPRRPVVVRLLRRLGCGRIDPVGAFGINALLTGCVRLSLPTYAC